MPHVGTLLARAEGPDPMWLFRDLQMERGSLSPGQKVAAGPSPAALHLGPWASGGPSKGLAECVPRSRREGAAVSSRFSQSRTHRPLTLVPSWALLGIT